MQKLLAAKPAPCPDVALLMVYEVHSMPACDVLLLSRVPFSLCIFVSIGNPWTEGGLVSAEFFKEIAMAR